MILIRSQIQVTVLTANGRDFENRCKLDIHQKKMELEYLATEKNLKRINKWQLRAEKNNIIKTQLLVLDPSQLTPTVDEWLNKTKRRHSMIQRVKK